VRDVECQNLQIDLLYFSVNRTARAIHEAP